MSARDAECSIGLGVMRWGLRKMCSPERRAAPAGEVGLRATPAVAELLRETGNLCPVSKSAGPEGT